MEHSRSRITFADDLHSYRLPETPRNDSVAESPPPPDGTVSVEEQQLSLNSCVDELVNILGTSVSRSAMVQSLLRHDLNFELALDEILRGEVGRRYSPDVVDVPASIPTRITPSPPSRPDPRSSPEFWSDESGGGNGAEAGASFLIGESESRRAAYRQENVADMLGFSDVLSSKLTSSIDRGRDAESTLENYCSSRISSPDVLYDARDLSARNDDVDDILNEPRGDGSEDDLLDLTQLLVDQVGKIKVKTQSRFSKKKGFQKMRPLDEMGNRNLSYHRLTTEMRRETVKARLIIKKSIAHGKRRDEADNGWAEPAEVASRCKSGNESALVVDHYDDSTPRRTAPIEKSKSAENSRPNSLLCSFPPTSIPDAAPLEPEDYLASRWAAGIQALRLERIAIKKLPQLKKAKCKSPSWKERDSPLWTYVRLSRSLGMERRAKSAGKYSEETVSSQMRGANPVPKKFIEESSLSLSANSSPSVKISNHPHLTPLQVPASTTTCITTTPIIIAPATPIAIASTPPITTAPAKTITTAPSSSPTPPSSSLPHQKPTKDEDDLDFLDDDFESVSSTLRKKPALPQTSPIHSALSSNYRQYFAQGARPKGRNVAKPDVAVDDCQRSNESEEEASSKSLPAETASDPIPDSSVDAARLSRPSVVSSSSTSSIPKKSSSLKKSSASKSPSPSPLRRMGKGLSLQQLAQEHAKNRSERSQSPLTKPQLPRLAALGDGEDGAKVSSTSNVRKLSSGSGGSPSRLCSWESSPSLVTTSSTASATAQKPSLSALSSLAKAHTSVASGGSLLKSLETLNLAKMTAEGTLVGRHLGDVLGLPGFQDISLTGDEYEAARSIVRSVSVMDVGIFDATKAVGGVSVRENAEDGNINVEKRFLYRRQHRTLESKKSKPSPKRSPSSATTFKFDTPSPDDIVSEKQKMAFEHSSKTKALPCIVSAEKPLKTPIDDMGTTSADGEEVKQSQHSRQGRKAESSSLETKKLSQREISKTNEGTKTVSPNSDPEDSEPDDWESHYFG